VRFGGATVRVRPTDLERFISERTDHHDEDDHND